MFTDTEVKARVCVSPAEPEHGRLSEDTERAEDAPIIRQLFSSSPRDPRYHMLSYISAKFSQEIRPQSHEPRAALFLNRFTRTLTIMYATNGLADVLGISAEELNGKSFYYCIQENCLQEAVRCLESAKANDSIAYLRFWFRDPRPDDQANNDQQADSHSSADEDDGGVHLGDRMVDERNGRSSDNGVSHHPADSALPGHQSWQQRSGSMSGNSTDMDMHGNEGIFDQLDTSQSSTTSLSMSDEGRGSCQGRQAPARFQIELEAVVSCTSDGLVVILRRARPLLPQLAQPTAQPMAHPYANGLFASPWATIPILPDRPYAQMFEQPLWTHPDQVPHGPAAAPMPTSVGPASEDFMRSIREVAVFAWALTGINGSLAQYSRGKPVGECIPPQGLLVWDKDPSAGVEVKNQNGFGSSSDHKYQNPKTSHIGNSGSGSRDYPSIHNGNPSNPWPYAPHTDAQTWDRGLPNNYGNYDVRHYDNIRRLGS